VIGQFAVAYFKSKNKNPIILAENPVIILAIAAAFVALEGLT
jgi:hypothetical protein